MKYQLGDLVRTVKGSVIQAEGIVSEIIQPSEAVKMLWGHEEPHYLVKDMKSGEFISVIEEGLEKL